MSNHVELIEKELEIIEKNNPDFFKLNPTIKLKDCVYVSFRKFADTHTPSSSIISFNCDLNEKIKTEIQKAASYFQSTMK